MVLSLIPATGNFPAMESIMRRVLLTPATQGMLAIGLAEGGVWGMSLTPAPRHHPAVKLAIMEM